jgi:hypothetical protein
MWEKIDHYIYAIFCGKFVRLVHTITIFAVYSVYSTFSFYTVYNEIHLIAAPLPCRLRC